MVTKTHVEANDIDSGFGNFFKDVFFKSGWAESGDDFGVLETIIFHCVLLFVLPHTFFEF